MCEGAAVGAAAKYWVPCGDLDALPGRSCLMLLNEAVSLCSLYAEQLLNCYGGASLEGVGCCAWFQHTKRQKELPESLALQDGMWTEHTMNAKRDSAMQTHKWLISSLSDRADRCCCRVCKTTYEHLRLHRPAPALQLEEPSSLQAAETAVLNTSRAR